MPSLLLYLLALVAVALAQAVIGSHRRLILLLVAFIVVAEAAHVVAIYSGLGTSVVASVLVLCVLLPWTAATAVLAWHPTNWRNGATSLASAGGYLSALLVGLLVGDMSGLFPQ